MRFMKWVLNDPTRGERIMRRAMDIFHIGLVVSAGAGIYGSSWMIFLKSAGLIFVSCAVILFFGAFCTQCHRTDHPRIKQLRDKQSEEHNEHDQ